jgi:hypothetical protein
MHAHPHLRYSFQRGSSSSGHPLLTVTISRPPLSLDEPVLFSWLRHAPDKETVGRKRKKKAAGESEALSAHLCSYSPSS